MSNDTIQSLFPSPELVDGMPDTPFPRPTTPRKKDRPIRFPMTDSEKAAIVLALLIEFFEGDEQEAIRFMRLHPSVNLVMPPATVTEKMIAERKVIKRLDVQPNEDTIKHLAHVQGVTRKEVVKTYTRSTGRAMPQRVIRIGRGYFSIAV